MMDLQGGAPAGSIETGLVPARCFESCVIDFTVPYTVAGDSSIVSLPGPITGHADALAVREFDVHLKDQRSGLVPTFTQHDAHGVCAALQIRRHIIR